MQELFHRLGMFRADIVVTANDEFGTQVRLNRVISLFVFKFFLLSVQRLALLLTIITLLCLRKAVNE